MAEGRALPKKESDLFKSINKFYEVKQYKKGLKASDAILKKFPNHGETSDHRAALAMRGLMLNCLDLKAEAYDHCKRGLKNDMRSHVCWYGLLYRSDRKYAEAIKSYKQALKIDSENIQILRDLSLLQVQVRDNRGFLETRQTLLRLNSNNKMHWVACALANDLVGAKATAIQLIDTFESSMNASSSGMMSSSRSQDPMARYEDSELALYKNSLLEAAGRFDEALAHLEAAKDRVVDGHAWRLKRAELRLYTERRAGGVAEWVGLMTHHVAGADNYTYHRGLQCAVLELPGERCRELMEGQRATATPTDVVALTEAQIAALDEVYAHLAECNPRADAYRWIPLTYAPGDDRFEARLDVVLRRFVRRGAPAFGGALERFWDVKAGEVTEGRARGVDACSRTLALVEKHVAALRGGCPSAGGGRRRCFCAEYAAASEKDQEEPPSTLLWALYLEAHCLAWLGRLEEALEVMDECIAHTPTAVDVYEKKASILKRQGRLDEAATEMDRAREVDLADRYINNKATKYLFRAGRVAEAKRTAAIFTRHEGDPEQHLADMQATWYELELGAAHARRKAPYGCSAAVTEAWATQVFHSGKALKKLLAVERHFADFVEDQFDFHQYCVRRMTLRAYVALLRFEENIRGHAVFCTAAVAAARVYLDIHDDRTRKERLEALEAAAADAAKKNGAGAGDEAGDAAAAKAAKKLEKLKQRKAAKKKEDAEKKAAEEAKARAAEEEAEARKKADEEAVLGAADGTITTTTEVKKRIKPPATNNNNNSKQPEDEDPDGMKLVTEADALAEATRLAATLDEFAATAPATHALSFDVALRRGKPLVALRALRRLAKLGADDDLVVRLATFAADFHASANSPLFADAVVVPEFADLCGASAASSGDQQPGGLLRSHVEALIDRRAASHPTLTHRVAAARALAILRPDEAASTTARPAQLILTADLADARSKRPLAIGKLEDALRALEDDLHSAGAARAFKPIARAKFPHAPAFAAA